MRALHRVAYLLKELEPRLGVQSFLIAITVERRARDIFHDEIRQAFFSHAAVEQTRDVGVYEARQNLALVAKAIEDEGYVKPAPHDLDGDALLKLLVVAFG